MEGRLERTIPQTEGEKVDLIQQVATDVREGRITDTHQVYEALSPLGRDFRDVEYYGTAIGKAIEQLYSECEKRDI